jgi:nicotinamidase-related amidase
MNCQKLTMLFPGPNGPLPAEILKMYPKMPLIQRNGEVNAWDNPDFRAAIRATGKKQIIVAGIVTDVCKLPWSNSACLF